MTILEKIDMRYLKKGVLLFSTLLIFGVLLMSACGTKEDPVPDNMPVQADNIVGKWSAFNVVVRKAGEISFVGEVIFNDDKKGSMKFDGFDKSPFDWKSNDSTVTITDVQFGIQVFKRNKNEKDDQMLSLEKVVDEFTEVTTMSLTRK